jgi:hypothetical protein
MKPKAVKKKSVQSLITPDAAVVTPAATPPKASWVITADKDPAQTKKSKQT